MSSIMFVQAGAGLYKVTSTESGLATVAALTLPTGVTIDASRRPRWAVFDRRVILAHSPSVNVSIHPDGTVIPLCLDPPASAPNVAVGGSGGLTGTYRVKVSYRIYDEDSGKLLVESPIGPASLAVALTADMLSCTGIPVSDNAAVNARVLYRNTDGGDTFFQWAEIEGNEETTFSDDLSDEALQLVAAPTDLTNAPGTKPGQRLKLLSSYRQRLFGVSEQDPDQLYYTSVGRAFTWDNSIPVGPLGVDELGCTSLIPRRDELGMARRDSLVKLVGSSASNFGTVIVSEKVGSMSQDAVKVIRDTAFFLGEDAVYQWDNSGVTPISAEKVDSWFTTDDVFNRSRFPYAFAHYDQKHNLYALHLAAAGSDVEDRWVAYDIRRKTWLGPHKTAAFLPTCAGETEDNDDLAIFLMGASNGFLYVGNRSAYSDYNSAIDMDVSPLLHWGQTPTVEKVWLEMDLLTKVESSGTLDVTPAIGGVSATAQTAISADLTLGRESLRRLSTYGQPIGRALSLRFQNNVAGERVVIYGYEVNYEEVGGR